MKVLSARVRSAMLKLVLPFAATIAFAAIGANSARAVSPALGAITPYGAQRGTEVEVVLSGARMNDAEEILLYYPGITVKSLEPTGENSVKAKIAIAPDCRLGIHALRLRTATGISNLREFSVGALPEVKEVEP